MFNDSTVRKVTPTINSNTVHTENRGVIVDVECPNNTVPALAPCEAASEEHHMTRVYVLAPTAMESAPKKGASGEVPPRVVEHIQSKVVKDGDAVTLSCKLTGQS